MFSSSDVALVAKGNRLRANKNNWGWQHKKMSHSFQRAGSKTSIAKKQIMVRKAFLPGFVLSLLRYLSLLILLNFMFAPIH